MMGSERSEEEKWTALGTSVGEARTVFIGRRTTLGIQRGASSHGRECAGDWRL